MKNSEYLEDELDLFEILSTLWKHWAIILSCTFLAFLVTVVYLKGTEKYFSTVIVSATSKVDILTKIHNLNEIDWLKRVALEIENTQLLYDAVKVAVESDKSALDGISSTKKAKELSADQFFHEELLWRIESSHQDREVIISLQTDLPKSGYTLLSVILELASDRAFEKLESEIAYKMVEYNRQLTNTLYFLGVGSDIRLIDEGCSRAIEEVIEKHIDSDEKLISLAAKELTESLPPVGSSSKITKVNKAKTITSVTLFGFIAGIIIALLFDSFEQRKKPV